MGEFSLLLALNDEICREEIRYRNCNNAMNESSYHNESTTITATTPGTRFITLECLDFRFATSTIQPETQGTPKSATLLSEIPRSYVCVPGPGLFVRTMHSPPNLIKN